MPYLNCAVPGVLASLALLLVGCGGASDSALFGSGGSNSGTPSGLDASPSPMPTSTSTQPPPVADAGAHSDATAPPPDASPSMDAQPPPVVDANPPVADANPPVDANPPPVSTMNCGKKGPCDLTQNVCCARTQGSSSPSFSCIPPSTCYGVALSCGSASDCTGGDVCCLTGDPQAGTGTSACMSGSACMSANGMELCDANDPNSACSGNTQCDTFQSPIPPYGTCQ